MLLLLLFYCCVRHKYNNNNAFNFLILVCSLCVTSCYTPVVAYNFGDRKRKPPLYRACPAGRYGGACENICDCNKDLEPSKPDLYECNDGVNGNGECTCIFGLEQSGFCKQGTFQPIAPVHKKLSLDALQFSDHDMVAEMHLPVDPSSKRSVRRVKQGLITHLMPSKFNRPDLFKLLVLDYDVASELGWLNVPISEVQEDVLALQIAGSYRVAGAKPFAYNYGGYQFGSWAGQLGDGRALSLGTAMIVKKEKQSSVCTSGNGEEDTCDNDKHDDVASIIFLELSLKGSGRTPYSRAGDGRAVLSSLAREYLGGIALHSLGIPSVRALGLVGTTLSNEADSIWRDEFYTGNIQPRAPGVLLRVAASFLRVGSLQIAALQGKNAFTNVVKVARHALRAIQILEKTDYFDPTPSHGDGSSQSELLFFPESKQSDVCFFKKSAATPSCTTGDPNALSPKATLKCFLNKFIERHAALIAAWNAAGFAHGVQNTDNIALVGHTIDLNVFGWLNKYDEHWSPNHIDDGNRYRFGNQNGIGAWNIQKVLAVFTGNHSLSHKIQIEKRHWLSNSDVQGKIEYFHRTYQTCITARMSKRLGLKRPDKTAVMKWRRFLTLSKADYARASRLLAECEKTHHHWRQCANDIILATSGDPRAFSAAVEFMVYLEKLVLLNDDWRNRIRWNVPRYTFRSKMIGDITRKLENRPDEPRNDTSTALELFEEVVSLLKSPFDHGPWNLREEVIRTEQESSYDANMNVTKETSARRLADTESEVTKTSCGGQ